MWGQPPSAVRRAKPGSADCQRDRSRCHPEEGALCPTKNLCKCWQRRCCRQSADAFDKLWHSLRVAKCDLKMTRASDRKFKVTSAKILIANNLYSRDRLESPQNLDSRDFTRKIFQDKDLRSDVRTRLFSTVCGKIFISNDLRLRWRLQLPVKSGRIRTYTQNIPDEGLANLLTFPQTTRHP
jgi:hypothetical protein